MKKQKNAAGMYVFICACGCGETGESKSAKAVYKLGHKDPANRANRKKLFWKLLLFMKNYLFNGKTVYQLYNSGWRNIGDEALKARSFDFASLPCPKSDKEGNPVFTFGDYNLTALKNRQYLIGKENG